MPPRSLCSGEGEQAINILKNKQIRTSGTDTYYEGAVREYRWRWLRRCSTLATVVKDGLSEKVTFASFFFFFTIFMIKKGSTWRSRGSLQAE